MFVRHDSGAEMKNVSSVAQDPNIVLVTGSFDIGDTITVYG